MQGNSNGRRVGIVVRHKTPTTATEQPVFRQRMKLVATSSMHCSYSLKISASFRRNVWCSKNSTGKSSIVQLLSDGEEDIFQPMSGEREEKSRNGQSMCK